MIKSVSHKPFPMSGCSLNKEEYLQTYVEDHQGTALPGRPPVNLDNYQRFNITPYGLNGYTDTAYVGEGKLFVERSAPNVPNANGGMGVTAWSAYGDFQFPGEGEIMAGDPVTQVVGGPDDPCYPFGLGGTVGGPSDPCYPFGIAASRASDKPAQRLTDVLVEQLKAAKK